MTVAKVLAIAALCLVICLIMGVAVTPAAAQGDGDKNLAQRKGVAGSLQTSAKPEGDKKGPSKLQMAVGVGSIFVMIAVVKWL